MGIPLGNNYTPTPPAAVRNIGDAMVVAIIDSDSLPWTEFGTDPPVQKIGTNGKPRTQEKITALVVNPGTGQVSLGEYNYRPAVAGDLVSFWLKGHRRGSFIDARKKLGRALEVGDVMQVKYERDEPSSKAGAADKKVHSFAMRGPKAEEAGQVQQCVDWYHKLRAEREGTQQAVTVPQVGSTVDDDDGDNEPF